MIRGFLFAILFIILEAVGFALIMPLIFPSADHQKLGALEVPFILLTGGTLGFLYGWRRSHRQLKSRNSGLRP